ncbi:MAG: ABC transporter ATP-binding protein [Actinomycetales bacterium]|nr:MAG: ABC transporter ATP-binding protein [Actinomycetales bacterium]
MTIGDSLVVEHLTVKYADKLALNDVNLLLANKGSIVGLFGQNGAGKTTLLRCIAGVMNRFHGSIRPRGSVVGYLPDQEFIPRRMRIRDVVRACDSLYADFDGNMATKTIAELDLSLDARVSTVSRGMSEQLHLSMILARRCGLYVLDEPLAAVDPLTRDKLLMMIKNYRKPGSTVVISTHLIGGLEGLFDEAIMIHQGKLILHDAVSAVLSQGGLEQRFKEVISAATS